MSLSVAAPAVTGTAAATLAAETFDGPWGPVLAVAAVCAALTVIFRFTHAGEILGGIRKLSRLAHLQESFLEDWNGEPGRDGVEPRPSFPARMARVEQRITDHSERNKQTIHNLQMAVDALGRDQLLVDTARAILTELGHDGDVQPGGRSGPDQPVV